MNELRTRILLVDDDEDDYFITRDLLSDIRDWELELDWARDYDKALDVLAHESHDVYLLDYRLGAHDGLALMREVFAHDRHAPVILLTGQDDPEVDVRAMKGGAADFLVKGQLTSSLLERSIRYAIEHNRVEEQLRQREEQLRLTLANAPLGLFTCDLECRFLSVNPAFESIVGFSAEQLCEKSLPELLFRGLESECKDDMRELVENEMKIARLDRFFIRGDGRQFEGILTASLMRDSSGRPQQLVGQLEDVTERRELERQLTQAEKLKSIGQLAAGVAHEINTPTQFVGQNLQFLADAFDSLLQLLPVEQGAQVPESVDLQYLLDEIPRALEQSTSGIERVSAIVRSVGELVHPDSRTWELVDLNRAVEATVLLTANQWRYVAEVSTDLDSELPQVLCHPGAINQVLVNLLVNATQAVFDRWGERDNLEGAIRIRTRQTGDSVEISISDNGGGIPAGVRSRIFDPFYTTKEARQATGQGLAISRNIVASQHGGKILVESEEGLGTTFRVLLPLAAEQRDSADEKKMQGVVKTR